MTATELRQLFNKTFYPENLEVSAETYGNVCNEILIHQSKQYRNIDETSPMIVDVAIGPHNGIMFKNVELILVNK